MSVFWQHKVVRLSKGGGSAARGRPLFPSRGEMTASVQVFGAGNDEPSTDRAAGSVTSAKARNRGKGHRRCRGLMGI